MAKVDTLIVSDLHVPYHDTGRLNEVIRWARTNRPRRIILIGDVVDAYCLSRFGKKLTVATTSNVQAEAQETKCIVSALLTTLQGSRTSFVYLAGNHEDRWRKRCEELPFLAPYAPDPFAALAREAGVRYVPSGMLRRGRLLVCHGDHGGWPARAEAKARRTRLSVIQGHTHRLDLRWLGPDWFAVECGHLVDTKAPVFDYSAGSATGLNGWRAGFAWIDEKGRPRLEAL